MSGLGFIEGSLGVEGSRHLMWWFIICRNCRDCMTVITVLIETVWIHCLVFVVLNVASNAINQHILLISSTFQQDCYYYIVLTYNQ